MPRTKLSKQEQNKLKMGIIGALITPTMFLAAMKLEGCSKRQDARIEQTVANDNEHEDPVKKELPENKSEKTSEEDKGEKVKTPEKQRLSNYQIQFSLVERPKLISDENDSVQTYQLTVTHHGATGTVLYSYEKGSTDPDIVHDVNALKQIAEAQEFAPDMFTLSANADPVAVSATNSTLVSSDDFVKGCLEANVGHSIELEKYAIVLAPDSSNIKLAFEVGAGKLNLLIDEKYHNTEDYQKQDILDQIAEKEAAASQETVEEAKEENKQKMEEDWSKTHEETNEEDKKREVEPPKNDPKNGQASGERVKDDKEKKPETKEEQETKKKAEEERKAEEEKKAEEEQKKEEVKKEAEENTDHEKEQDKNNDNVITDEDIDDAIEDMFKDFYEEYDVANDSNEKASDNVQVEDSAEVEADEIDDDM